MVDSRRKIYTYLSEEVPKSPSDKRGECLGSQGILIQRVVVSGPSGNGSSSNLSGILEKRTRDGRVSSKGRLDTLAQLGRRPGGVDTESAGSEEGNKEETEELHGGCIYLSCCWKNWQG
jgi:hypothetical protein